MGSNLKKYLYALIGFIIIAGGIAGYYFLYYVKTPEYTIKIIKDAYSAHDVYKIHRHIDIDNILNKYLDEAMISVPELQNNPFAEALVPAFKQIAISMAKEKVDQAIIGDLPTTESEETGSKPSNDLQTAVKKSKVESISSEKIDNNNAEIYLIVKDDNNKEHKITLKAGKLDDGTWRIYEVPGMYKLVQEINAD